MIGFDVRLRHIPGVSTQAAHDLLQAAAMFFCCVAFASIALATRHESVMP